MSTPTYPSGNPSGRASVPAPPPSGYRGTGRVQGRPPSRRYQADDQPGYGGGNRDGGGGARPYSGRRRPRRGRIALVLGLALLLVAVVGLGGAYLYYRNIDSGLQRTDAFGNITGDRPAVVVAGAQNLLLLGSDSRDPDNKAQPGKWRTDTMIVMHVAADHKKAYLISLPRDLYVRIPQSPTNPELGNTNSKINAAFAWGGVPLAVQTVEGYTGVHIDHVVLVDFGGFQQVTDALGGVDLNIEQNITSIHPPFRKFAKGVNHLNGAEALDYVRQRKQFADGDFARMRHQQEFLKALMDKAASSGTIGNPLKLNAFLKSVTKAMTVDNQFSLSDTALAFRGIRSDNLTFMVSPNVGSQTIGGESVVVSDKTKALALYQSVANDTVGDWVASNAAARSGG